jgi:hypothetical protein
VLLSDPVVMSQHIGRLLDAVADTQHLGRTKTRINRHVTCVRCVMFMFMQVRSCWRCCYQTLW